MQQVVPWLALITLIEPHYPSSGRVGRPPIGVPRMLRMYFLQPWCSLSDEGLEDAVYDSQAMREFVSIDLAREKVPEATTLLKFRRLLNFSPVTWVLPQPTRTRISVVRVTRKTHADSPSIMALMRSVTFFRSVSISASSRGGSKTKKCRLNGIS